MMIGPYPGSPNRIDGGAASALTYLSQGLATRSDIDLVGVRIADTSIASGERGEFDWPIVDLPLGRLGLTTFYRRQRHYMEKLIERFRPAIVHAQGIDLPGYLAANCSVPAVVTVHGILSEETQYGAGLKLRIRSFLNGALFEKSTVRRATNLISISPYVTQHYGSLVRGHIHEVPNAIASKYFEVQRAPERGRFLFAGRIIRRKGVHDLVRALANNRDRGTRLIIAGAATEPDYERLVRAEVERTGMVDQVEFRGLLGEAEMLQELARAEALVLPSYQETAPMVVQQAMAAGLVVIASRICGLPYQVEHGVTGFLHEAGSVKELARLIQVVRENPSLAVQMGEAGRAVALERYHAARVTDATVSVYKSMI